VYKMKYYQVLFAVIFCLYIALVSTKVGKHVRIGLDAKWKQTPFTMEASEYISERSNEKFWKYIKSFEDQDQQVVTPKDEYSQAIAKASLVLSAIQINAMKFSMSLRSYSARVQLFNQIGTPLSTSCNDNDMFYQIEDTTYCDFEDIFELIKKSETKGLKSNLHSFDHVYPGTEANNLLVILYGDFTSKQLQNKHKLISSKVQELNITYVYRPFYQPPVSTTKIMLSGYGVELAVKSTEYKAVDDQKVQDKKKNEKRSDNEEGDDELEGFLFKRLRELHPTLKEDLDQYKEHLKEGNKELAPLRVWQLQDLSYQASQRIKSASSQDTLRVLKDLSQNAPMVARSLVKTKVNEEFRKEVTENQQEFEQMGVTPGSAGLFINGIELAVDELDAFKLFTVINGETDTMSEISQLKLDMSKVGQLLALNIKPKTDNFILDTRSESVQWLNNLEKDSQYNYWPSSLNEILRPTFPGMMRYIAKNVFHVVAFVDPLSEEFFKLLKNCNELIDNSVPARFGMVFVVDGSIKDSPEENVGAAIVRAFSFIKSDKNGNEAFSFLTKLYGKASVGVPTYKELSELFTSMYGASETEEALGEDSEYDDLRKTSYQKYVSLGIKTLPNVLVNGETISHKDIINNLEQSLVEKILAQTPQIQQAVYMGSYYSYPSVYDFVMSQPNVATRINPLIQTVKGKYMKFSSEDNNNVDVSSYTSIQASNHLLQNVKYFISDKGASTVFVVANADTVDGRTLITNAMKYVLKQKDLRLAVILHSGNQDDTVVSYNTAIQIIFDLREKLISGVAKLLLKFLESDDPLTDLLKTEDSISKVASGITGINKKKLYELLTSADTIKQANFVIDENHKLLQKALNIKVDDNYVIANGRLIGPLVKNDILVKEDFELLQNFENGRCGYKINEIVNKMSLPDLPTEGIDRYKSDLVMKTTMVLSELDKDTKRTVFTYKDDKHSVVHLPAQSSDIASLDVDAILDPLSKGAQKLASILPVIYESFNVNLKIFLNPKAKHSEMPVNRFYQYVMQSKLNFNDDGSLVADQAAVFTSLPHSALLTLIMDTPQSWLIEATGSNHDLDNIHLDKAGDVVYGDFELENIIVQGSCTDVGTHQHPRGLQFVLGTQAEPDMFDTIVMANLGYFQLKAFPGSFVLQLREGRSSQIYQIESLEGGQVLNEGQNYTVVIDDFTGKFLKVKVKRQEGKEKEDLLGGDGKEDEDEIFGLWDSIASYVKTKEKSSKNTDGKIHIFSVATGLLYERFLRIMMLSVLKHTKTPVKFWFLKNYLSASLTSFLPHFAEKYGFEYELVQYQWPKWLNGQTEKQRIIWGYKILFLDVLFPLNLERIVFVDADQIVRADLKELMDMDLDGAPYAYTPFCNDRPEVEGFRFWNQGYWRNHLAGRPYHISALYVVDLKRFRRVAAGDRLRGQYQGLSQDPNSLSNLDQDLPNNMIHQVQIKSLPQEWLWCETWCSDESKAKAKTIDMCNNPQTKEPKLQRAMRIAPEWIEYDEVIKKLMDDTSNITTTDTTNKSDPSQRTEL